MMDKTQILSALHQDAMALFPHFKSLSVIPSTNDYLSERLSQGLMPGTVCIADGQTQGKGRLGKKWDSPVGSNIYLSFYWQLPRNHPNLAALTLVIGLAALTGLNEIQPFPDAVGIKWPNDLWHGDAKWGGILVEQFSRGSDPNQMVDLIIGIGINVCNAEPLAVDCAYTDLTKIWGKTPDRARVIAAILNQFAKDLPLFQREGLAPFLSLWQKHDRLLNRPIVFSNPQGSQTGIAQGINADGELLVQAADHTIAVRSAEVHVAVKGVRYD